MIEGYQAFMQRLQENAARPNPERMAYVLATLEHASQSPDRAIEIYTDPELDTFFCAQVPAKRVTLEGEIVDDPVRKQYIIGAPFGFIAGDAPLNFLLGEIRHEKGHTEWTDYGRLKRFESLARQEGYDPQEILELNNCLEDPRMERLVGGPLHENARLQLFEKNSKMIIPDIVEGIHGKEMENIDGEAGGVAKMSPTDQFKFMIKLERLWALHEKEVKGVEKPWGLDDLHPRVREEYLKIEQIVAQITGDAVKPAMKVNPEIEKLIVEHIWPALKRLIDEFPDKSREQKQQGSGGGDGEGEDGEPGEDQSQSTEGVDQRSKQSGKEANGEDEEADRSDGKKDDGKDDQGSGKDSGDEKDTAQDGGDESKEGSQSADESKDGNGFPDEKDGASAQGSKDDTSKTGGEGEQDRRDQDESGEQEGKPSEQGQAKGGKQQQQGKRGQPSEGGTKPEEDPNLDPHDPSSWPIHFQKILKKMIEQHNQRLEQRAREAKERAEQNKETQAEREQEKHELQKSRDNFNDPVLREKYNELRLEVNSATQRLKRIFKRFVPKVDELEYEWSRRGIRFDVRRYVQRIGTGTEKPMGRRETPEETAMVLQILVDVSGSMYSNDQQRIVNAVKSCIATCEAAKDYNVYIEILASDDKNLTHDERYIIKAANEPYDGRVKSRIVMMLDSQKSGFGGDNRDAEAIEVAVPRLKKILQRKRAEVDRIGSLMIFITDSTTQEASTKQAADEARKFTPLEGTAITPEPEVAGMVQYHFGKDSIIPKSVNEFPEAMQAILQKHLAKLKPKE